MRTMMRCFLFVLHCKFKNEGLLWFLFRGCLSADNPCSSECVPLFVNEFGMAWWSDGVRRERLVCCHCVIGTQLALTVYSVRAFHQKGTWHHYGRGAMTQPAKNVLFGSGVMRNLQHSVVMQRHNPQDDVCHPDDSLSQSDVSFVGMCPVYYWSVPSSGWQCVLRVLLTVRRDIIDAGCWLLSLCQAVCL